MAHRMSTIKNADRIYVVDDGKIIEEGKHDELMNLGKKYAAMYTEYSKAVNWRIGSC